MKRRFPSLTILIALFALTASAAWAGAKVQVCHIPPGNPGNFHTITVSQNAVQAHLGHGDLVGACSSNCDSLCSEDNPCTTGECACPCVAGVPDFIEALNGQFGLTSCQVHDFTFSVSVQLNTDDGRSAYSQSGFNNGCGFLFPPGPTLFISQAEAEACASLIRQKAAAAGLTCTP
jgi:hypothetical protein